MNFKSFSVSLFGNYVNRHERYLRIRKKLRSAHIFRPYEEYVSEAILLSLIVAFLGMVIGLIIGFIISMRMPVPVVEVYDPGVADFLSIFTPYKKQMMIASIGGLFFISLLGIVYSAFMVYPSLLASIRKAKIDTQLPHAIMYMYALSRGETNITEIIKSVAELPNVYGEVSNEFAMILRDIEFLGIDFMNALRNVQNQTPSENLNLFLGNLVTLIDNGGDVTDFFGMQIENYRTMSKSEHTLFLDLLGMVAESYVTGFVAGPLFMIIVAATLGSMKGSMNWLLMGMTYGVLPFGSFGFMIFIDTLLPKEEQVIGTLNLRRVKEFLGIPRIKKEEEKLFKEYEKSKKWIRLQGILRDPLHAFFEEPVLSLYVSVPASLLIILISILMNPKVFFRGYIAASGYLTNYILLGIIVAIVPYTLFYEARYRKIWGVENAIPSFLKNLSIINETGLSLAESLRIVLRTERGPLRSHVERMYTDISWGASVVEAFTRFANKIRLNMLSRVVALVTKASESSGDIRQVLNIAVEDTNINLQLKKDKSTNMLIYIIVIYIAFLVFLYVVYTLATTFLPQMAKGAQAGSQGFIRNFNLEFYKVYFYHTALVQAFFSGMMAGVLGQGNLRLGLKHSLVLMMIAFLAFKVLVKV